MRNAAITLYSPLTPDAAAGALRACTDEGRWLSVIAIFGRRPLLGKIDRDFFRVRKPLSFDGRLGRTFHGRFIREADGTRVDGYFERRFPGEHLRWMIFGVFGAIAAGILVFVVGDSLIERRSLNAEDGIRLLASGMIASLLMLSVEFSRWIGGRDEAYILERVKKALTVRIGGESESVPTS